MVAFTIPIKHVYKQNEHNNLPFCVCGKAKDLHEVAMTLYKITTINHNEWCAVTPSKPDCHVVHEVEAESYPQALYIIYEAMGFPVDTNKNNVPLVWSVEVL